VSLVALAGALQAEFGLVLFTVVAIVLMGYLAYSMARPEKF
jgi:K+-transporting ATPase KdpF subunit